MIPAIKNNLNLTLPAGLKKWGRFFLHLLEMQLAMSVGMMIFHLMYGLLPATSDLALAAAPGTNLHAILMNGFMVVPMVAWMVFRGHGWRHGIEMMLAMLVPVALVGLLCQLGFDAYLPWLEGASVVAMYLGMIGVMLYRRSHYTGEACHTLTNARQ